MINWVIYSISRCDPTNLDTDGDLLLDGFEWFYGMNPKGTDSISDDEDGDGQTTLQEQAIFSNLLKTLMILS